MSGTTAIPRFSARAKFTAASPRSSPVSRSENTRTSIPASRSSRAAARPSPPLLPGPQTTTARLHPGNAASVSSVRTAAAFSISVSEGVPARIAAASLDSNDVFRINLLWPIIQRLQQLSGRSYDTDTVAIGDRLPFPSVRSIRLARWQTALGMV